METAREIVIITPGAMRRRDRQERKVTRKAEAKARWARMSMTQRALLIGFWLVIFGGCAAVGVAAQDKEQVCTPGWTDYETGDCYHYEDAP